jgi:hypothetical protein
MLIEKNLVELLLFIIISTLQLDYVPALPAYIILEHCLVIDKNRSPIDNT